MKSSRGHNLLVELELDVKAAGEESALGSEHQSSRIEGMLDGSVRRSLGDGAELRGRRILPFGQTINLVVEKDDVDVDIAPDGVDEMVASDSQGIAVTAGLPYGKPGIGHLYACRNCCCPSVDAVEAVGIHIVGQTRRAAYTRNHHIALLVVVQGLTHLGESPLKSREHCVVAATGAPPHLLIALEILKCKICHNYIFFLIASTSSLTRKG